MDFFKVTKEDIDKVKENKGINFKHGDVFTMIIEELKEVTETGKEKLIVSGKIVGGEYNGRKHSIFVFKNSMSFFIDLLMCFFSEADITAGKATPEALVGKMFTSHISISQYNGKDYTNYRKVTAASSVPDMPIAQVQANQAAASKDLF
jgi:hypothetical protein